MGDSVRWRSSTRTRFAAATAALVAATGALILLVVYFAMRYLNDYRFPVGSATPLDRTTMIPEAVPSTIDIVHEAGAADVGIVVTSSDGVLDTLLIFSVAALAVLSLLGAVASWFLAGRMLRPLRRLSAAADRARAGSLEHRVGSTGRADEFEAVSQAFDAMLEQLERSFAASQRFAANASHEIRTPLATTKALLQVAAADEQPPDTRLLLARLAESNDRLISIVDALLDLAAAEQVCAVDGVVEVGEVLACELAELTEEITHRGLRVCVRADEIAFRGHERLMRLLIGNVLRNAVRHNLPGGDVRAELRACSERRSEGGIALIVENSGEMVPPEALKRLCEPFYRLDERTAPDGEASGHGLGLALVAGIVAALDGTLRLDAREEGGLRVTVELPQADAIERQRT